MGTMTTMMMMTMTTMTMMMTRTMMTMMMTTTMTTTMTTMMTTMTMMMTTTTTTMMMTNLHHHQKNLRSPKNPRRMNYRRTPAPTTFQSEKPFYNLFGAINDFDT